MALVELLLASVLMVMIAGGIAALALAVQTGNQHSSSLSRSLQHGRVAIERLERALRSATASEPFPGFATFSTSVAGYQYPDTLVAWQPEGPPSDPDGLPLFNELLVFCPDPTDPRRLLEIRSSSDYRTVPPLDDLATWESELDYLRGDMTADRVVITDLLRVASPGNSLADRGAVRFFVRLRPTPAEWAAYLGGSIPVESLSWPQDLYGARGGLRQAWCRIELQLRPGGVPDHSSAAAIPLFGSAAVLYQLEKE